MIEQAHELGNRFFEIDVVLPKRVVGINQQRLRVGNGLGHRLRMITEKGLPRINADQRGLNAKQRIYLGRANGVGGRADLYAFPITRSSDRPITRWLRHVTSELI